MNSCTGRVPWPGLWSRPIGAYGGAGRQGEGPRAVGQLDSNQGVWGGWLGVASQGEDWSGPGLGRLAAAVSVIVTSCSSLSTVWSLGFYIYRFWPLGSKTVKIPSDNTCLLKKANFPMVSNFSFALLSHLLFHPPTVSTWLISYPWIDITSGWAMLIKMFKSGFLVPLEIYFS